jgi:hypothetical protein
MLRCIALSRHGDPDSRCSTSARDESSSIKSLMPPGTRQTFLRTETSSELLLVRSLYLQSQSKSTVPHQSLRTNGIMDFCTVLLINWSDSPAEDAGSRPGSTSLLRIQGSQSNHLLFRGLSIGSPVGKQGCGSIVRHPPSIIGQRHPRPTDSSLT